MRTSLAKPPPKGYEAACCKYLQGTKREQFACWRERYVLLDLRACACGGRIRMQLKVVRFFNDNFLDNAIGNG